MKQQLTEMKGLIILPGLAAIKFNILTFILHCTYSISESTIDKKLEEFQKALYRHQNTTPDTKIYDPDAMQQFTDKNSPGLFQDPLTCITGGKSLTEKRKQLQEQRVVALLHIFAYSPGILRKKKKIAKPQTNCKRRFLNGFFLRHMSFITYEKSQKI